tara:strand:+ start:814 stop:1650 length:837 start_codon:yes stop_codon:yes gene_type:complete
MKNLIIGGSSKIGRNLNLNSDKFDVTYYKNKISKGILVNIKDRLSNQLNLDKYSTVIILSSITDPRICQENRTHSENINVKYTKNLVNECIDNKKKIIFFSSDYIFDGKKGNYSENDYPNPINLYGEQKLKIENYIKSQSNNYTILRISKTFFQDFKTDCFLKNIVKKIKEPGNSINCIEKQIFSPIFVKDIADVLKKVVNSNIKILNVGGPDVFDRKDIINLVAKKLNKKKKILILKNKKIENDSKFNWPQDVSLSISKLKKIKKSFTSLNKIINSV